MPNDSCKTSEAGMKIACIALMYLVLIYIVNVSKEVWIFLRTKACI